MNANRNFTPPRPKRTHGRVFLYRALRANGTVGTGVVRHNGYEFDTAYSQCMHEATVIAEREGTTVARLVAARFEKAVVPFGKTVVVLGRNAMN